MLNEEVVHGKDINLLPYIFMLEFIMPKGISDKITFKPYDVGQGELIPPTADELIPANHLVRVVNATLDQLNLFPILKQYTGGGASRYNPLMLLKVIVYGYLNNVCSSRMIAKHVRENIYFRWIAGCQMPDFRTINSFRKEKLTPVINEVFVEVVKLLHQQGYVQLNTLYVDGTKIESRSNRYTFVWRKSVDTFDHRLEEKIRLYLRDAQQLIESENIEFGEDDLPEMGKGPISSETIAKMAAQINKSLENISDKEDRKVKKKLVKIHKVFTEDFLPRKRKYEYHRTQFNGRNSYSKTDPDATFMRMKEDHMLNGQLKPGYNIQVGTESGFVTSYAVFPNPTDTKTLQPFLDHYKNDYAHYPKSLIADKGYASIENYAKCEEKDIDAYIKYPHWDQEKKKRSKKYRYRWWNFKYDVKSDQFTCPEGQSLTFLRYTSRTRYDGSKEKIRVYSCSNCNTCTAHEKCTKSQQKKLEFNPRRYELHQNARKRLKTEKGWNYYRKRGSEVETVFGQVKGNWGLRRFRGWGKENATCEWGLQMVAYNLKNLYATWSQ